MAKAPQRPKVYVDPYAGRFRVIDADTGKHVSMREFAPDLIGGTVRHNGQPIFKIWLSDGMMTNWASTATIEAFLREQGFTVVARPSQPLKRRPRETRELTTGWDGPSPGETTSFRYH